MNIRGCLWRCAHMLEYVQNEWSLRGYSVVLKKIGVRDGMDDIDKTGESLPSMTPVCE